jgi:nitrate/nitrite-specific signal transduction histidine kinase
MTIKTKINILLYMSVVLTVTAALTIFYSSRVLNAATVRDRNSSSIVKGVFELSILTDDLLYNHLDRTAKQWNTRYASLLSSLKTVKPLFEEGLVSFEEVEQNLNRIEMIILKFNKENRFHQGIVGSAENDSIMRLYQTKISSLLHNIVFSSEKLEALSHAQLEASHENINLIFSIAIMGFLMLIIIFSVLFFTRILEPIKVLFEGAQAVGKGNFDYTIPETAQDEFGMLSRAFNVMSRELKVITVSRDDLEREVKTRKKTAKALLEEKEKAEEALAKVKKLSGLLPICSHCKKVRDDKGYWNEIEAYLGENSEAEFSHGICQECAENYYPGMDLYGDHQSSQ